MSAGRTRTRKLPKTHLEVLRAAYERRVIEWWYPPRNSLSLMDPRYGSSQKRVTVVVNRLRKLGLVHLHNGRGYRSPVVLTSAGLRALKSGEVSL